MSSEQVALQGGEGSKIMVDPQKLARFFQQLNTIQAKIARLQAERTANALREQNLQVSNFCLSSTPNLMPWDGLNAHAQKTNPHMPHWLYLMGCVLSCQAWRSLLLHRTIRVPDDSLSAKKPFHR